MLTTSRLSLSPVQFNVMHSVHVRHALAAFNREERAKRENQILSDFRSMVHKKLKKSSS